jgi:hypothetical protein
METGEFPQQVGFQIFIIEVVFLSTTRSKFVVFRLNKKLMVHSFDDQGKHIILHIN